METGDNRVARHRGEEQGEKVEPMSRTKLISLRVPTDDLEVLKVAAGEEHRSLTNFLITHGLEQARKTLAISATKPTFSDITKRTRKMKTKSQRDGDEGRKRTAAEADES
jgi:hypothetical protein